MKNELLNVTLTSLEEKIEKLAPLVAELKGASCAEEKLEFLDRQLIVKEFFENPSFVRSFLFGLSSDCAVVIKAVIAVGQGERVLHISTEMQDPLILLRKLIEDLLPVEKFYQEIGGIVGYHWMTLRLLAGIEGREGESSSSTVKFHAPEGFDISTENAEVCKEIISGVEHLAEMAEIYPLGGAADRLRLFDEKTRIALPAARLSFCGKTLLGRMISDLQAKEYLHYKLYGKQLVTPLAIMTSAEKDNHSQIISICEENKWFGRGKENFRFFCQPLVPAMNRSGEWRLQGSLQLLLKPGGHGVIWKLAREEGVFDWLKGLGRKKALVRQINNPIAGIDYGLLAFTGLGCQKGKAFGFASCPRQVKSSEGMNVLVQKKEASGDVYALTNIEYCDFTKFQIIDEPKEPGSSFSKFPSNTNILFVDIAALLDVLSDCPLPGMLVNLKKTAYKTEQGEMHEEEVVRLETTMQNIADCFVDADPNIDRLRTFLTYNERAKTISTIKKEYILGASLIETPEGCFLDLLQNARILLAEHCGMQLPVTGDAAHYFRQGPSFIFLYHPALGPLYAIISQKIRGGRLAQGAELDLEIAEAFFENLDLTGSLRVHALAVTGEKDATGRLVHSEKSGKCYLKNVKVANQGIDWQAPNILWKNEIFRQECCEIIIEGDGEFFAENVTLAGNCCITVQKGTRIRAVQEGEEVVYYTELLSQPSWYWKYEVGPDYSILLSL